MTKVKVGKEDQSSNEFVEKRRSALERYDMKKTTNTQKHSCRFILKVHYIKVRDILLIMKPLAVK